MALRLTKQQRAYQEEILAIHGLSMFKPNSKLVEQLAGFATSLQQNRNDLFNALTAEKSKSLWRIFRERYL